MIGCLNNRIWCTSAGVLEFIGVGQVTDVTEQAILALAAKVLFFYLIGLQPGHLYQKF